MYLLLSNVVVGVLLIVTFEPLSETTEVINQNAVPLLKPLHEDNDKQLQAGNDKRLHNDNDQAFAYIERMLAKAQTEALRIRMEVRIIAAWFLVNAVLSWWCFVRQHRAGVTEPSTALKSTRSAASPPTYIPPT